MLSSGGGEDDDDDDKISVCMTHPVTLLFTKPYDCIWKQDQY